MEHQHVIPVPPGMTPGEAWAEITIMGKLVNPVPGARYKWATIECDGTECADVEVVTDA